MYSYRLTESDRYPLGDTQCTAIMLVEHSDSHPDIQAIISPQMGMSLIGFAIGNVSLLQQSRKPDFTTARKGLGPLIIPHFNQRDTLPELDKDIAERIPHKEYMSRLGVEDPFQHGIGRYVEWEYETQTGDDSVSVTGQISGQSLYLGHPLAEFTGYNFNASVTYTLAKRTLTVSFDIHGDEPVVCGVHYYYALPDNGKSSRVEMSVESMGIDVNDELYEFSEHQRDGKFYTLPLAGFSDTVFTPVSEKKGTARYKLITPDYRLDTSVLVDGEREKTFGSVVVYHPEGTDFVCVEPLSEQNGLRPEKNRFSGKIELHPILQ